MTHTVACVVHVCFRGEQFHTNAIIDRKIKIFVMLLVLLTLRSTYWLQYAHIVHEFRACLKYDAWSERTNLFNMNFECNQETYNIVHILVACIARKMKNKCHYKSPVRYTKANARRKKEYWCAFLTSEKRVYSILHTLNYLAHSIQLLLLCTHHQSYVHRSSLVWNVIVGKAKVTFTINVRWFKARTEWKNAALIFFTHFTTITSDSVKFQRLTPHVCPI